MKRVLLIWVAGLTAMCFYSCGNSSAKGNDAGLVNDLDRRITMGPDSSYAISAFINDADDPMNLLGIDFNVGKEDPPIGDLRITASSSNTAVVPDTNLIISG